MDPEAIPGIPGLSRTCIPHGTPNSMPSNENDTNVISYVISMTAPVISSAVRMTLVMDLRCVNPFKRLKSPAVLSAS